MHRQKRECFARLSLTSAAFGVALVFLPCVATAQDKGAAGSLYVMKISTPTINDVPDTYARNFGAAVERDSGGRIKVEVYPASQLGSIPRQIEGTQFGAIQCEVVPPEFMVGLDQRFEVLAAPGLVSSLAQGQNVAADPEVRKLMLSLGADKGLHGVGLFMADQADVVAKNPIRHIGDFKGKKIRIFASKFQSEAFERLGVTPVAMTLGDVLPAIQQGTIDGAITGMGPVAHMHFVDAAKYVTMINQPAISSSPRSIRSGSTACPKICNRSSNGMRCRNPQQSVRSPPICGVNRKPLMPRAAVRKSCCLSKSRLYC